MRTVRLASKNRVPYGGYWTWRDSLLPRSEPVVGTTWDMLIDRARAQRYANSIPCGLSFEEEVEKALCRDYPQECFPIDPDAVPPRRLSIWDVLSGTTVMLTHKLAGSPLVSQEEAERRAVICLKCPQNKQFVRTCAACPDLEKVTNAVIGHQRTKHDPDLHSCSVCACFLKSAIWIELEIQQRPLTEMQRDQFRRVAKSMAEEGLTGCWKAEGL